MVPKLWSCIVVAINNVIFSLSLFENTIWQAYIGACRIICYFTVCFTEEFEFECRCSSLACLAEQVSPQTKNKKLAGECDRSSGVPL